MIVALVVAWLLANAPVLRWAAWTWTEQAHSRENWVLAGAGLVWVAARARWRAPRLATGPALLVVTCAVLGRVLAAGWDVHVLEAALFLLGGWGLAGLCLDRAEWRAGWPAALALVALLPFDGALDTFLGFPLRVATATVVAGALGLDGADTLVRFENRVAHVDVPCSGVGGLWVGTVLLLVATAIEGRRLGARWVALWIATMAAQILTNGLRVLGLALLLPWPTVATVLHVPMGVVGFTLVAALALGGLRFVPRHPRAGETPAPTFTGVGAGETPAPTEVPRSPAGLALLAALVLALATPSPSAEARAADVPALALTVDGLSLDPLPFSDAERRVFATHGAVAAAKWRFTFVDTNVGRASRPPFTGSLLVVRTLDWRAHHPPAGCHRADGRDAGSPRTRLLDGRPYALAEVEGGAAAWWFASPSGETADYTARVWREVVGGERDWTMVSLLADAPADDAAVDALVRAIRDAPEIR